MFRETKCGKAIRTMLMTSVSLSHLFLRWNRFLKDDMQALGEGVSGNESLVSLDLAFNALSKCHLILRDDASEIVDCFFNALSTHGSLRHLDLSFNDFSVDECRKLGELLRRNFSIVGLH